MRFGKKGKLSLRYVGPHEVVKPIRRLPIFEITYLFDFCASGVPCVNAQEVHR